MTLDKAIKILENAVVSGTTTQDPDYIAALKLAIAIMEIAKIMNAGGNV